MTTPYATRFIGKYANRLRLAGAGVLGGLAIWCGVNLAFYSQVLTTAAPADVESVATAQFLNSGSGLADGYVSAVQAELSGTDFDITGEDTIRIRLVLRLSGSYSADAAPKPRFILGGRLADAVENCDGVTISRRSFNDLDEGQSAVTSSIEAQLNSLRSIREVSETEATDAAVLRRAGEMRYISLEPDTAESSSWDQSTPDELRTLPIDSPDRLPPSESDFSGVQWAVDCEANSTLIKKTEWGSRLDLPSLGIALPVSWRTNLPLAGDQFPVPGVAVEALSTLTWRVGDLGYDAVSTTETGTSLSNSWWTETERSGSLKTTTALTAGTLDTPWATITADDHFVYAGGDRFSIRYSTAFYRSASVLALFAAGALFSLAATMLIAVLKTLARLRWRSPKT